MQFAYCTVDSPSIVYIRVYPFRSQSSLSYHGRERELVRFAFY